MNRWITMGLVGFCLSPLSAETAKPVEAERYLEQLQLKLEHAARRSNEATSGASNVVGLRGSKQEPLSKQLYWKGQSEPVVISPQEVKAYRAAVEYARAGDKTKAIDALKTFLAQFPDSPLKPDVEETLRIIADLPAAVSSPA